MAPKKETIAYPDLAILKSGGDFGTSIARGQASGGGLEVPPGGEGFLGIPGGRAGDIRDLRKGANSTNPLRRFRRNLRRRASLGRSAARLRKKMPWRHEGSMI